jgi:hypothetical protein
MDPASPPLGFDTFSRLVFDQPSLLKLLQEAPHDDALAARAVELGRDRGCIFSEDDVRQALRAARMEWIQRAAQ